jgi:hypothetical protein
MLHSTPKLDHRLKGSRIMPQEYELWTFLDIAVGHLQLS